jgi:hypothetical protein
MLRDLLAWDASERFRPDQRLFELGLQSRNVVELKDRLEATFAVGLPVTLFFRQTTLEMLTTHLLTVVLKLAPPSQTPPHTPLKPFVPIAMEQLERLSEAEAEARLLDKLAEVQKRIEP